LSAPADYAALRRAVEATVFQGRAEIERAWVKTYHETGRLISEHLLQRRERADYGGKLLRRLAGDTGISERTLYECRQFHRCFPILRARAKLTWAHYRVLCQLEDEMRRETLLREAERNGWTTNELASRVRGLNAAAPTTANGVADKSARAVERLPPKRGTPGICRVVTDGAGLAADLGFATFLPLTGGSSAKAGDFVRVSEGRITIEREATRADLFTYHGEVLKVVDGDTLWVRVALPAGVWIKQKLRLRDLDAPEMATAEGRAAKRFTEGLLARGQALIFCTTKPDKYDRYLADVFVAAAEGGPDVFLNQALLDAGHAGLKRAWEFSDWEE
jgi:endonuclease YncB( thermonuclease family)